MKGHGGRKRTTRWEGKLLPTEHKGRTLQSLTGKCVRLSDHHNSVVPGVSKRLFWVPHINRHTAVEKIHMTGTIRGWGIIYGNSQGLRICDCDIRALRILSWYVSKFPQRFFTEDSWLSQEAQEVWDWQCHPMQAAMHVGPTGGTRGSLSRD